MNIQIHSSNNYIQSPVCFSQLEIANISLCLETQEEIERIRLGCRKLFPEILFFLVDSGDPKLITYRMSIIFG